MVGAMRGNHHNQEIALFVLVLIHHGVYQDVPKKLADLGHKVNYERSTILKERQSNGKGKGEKKAHMK